MGQVPKEKPNAAGAAPKPGSNAGGKNDAAANGGKANDFAAAKNAAMFSGKKNPAG